MIPSGSEDPAVTERIDHAGGLKQVLAASGIALAAITLSGAGSATAAPVKAAAECGINSNWSTYAETKCYDVKGHYRVAVNYCRVSCTEYRGDWVTSPYVSRVDGFPTGGSIASAWTEFAPW